MFAIMFFILSCNDYALKQSFEPEIVVYPPVINFGHLISGIETGQKDFLVINAGNNTLTFTRPDLTTENKFSLDQDLESNYTLEPGELLSFYVYYNPETFESPTSSIVISTNDSNESDIEVPVIGFGDAPIISLEPLDLNLGDQINIGCEINETVTITNDGNIDLVVDSITQMVTIPADISYDQSVNSVLPLSLIPNESYDLQIQYIPTNEDSDVSVITIHSNDPVNSEIDASQSGSGVLNQSFADTYVGVPTVFLDVLFVIDNSGSMMQFQFDLLNQMSLFMSVFSMSNADYHLGFITTDSEIFVQNRNLNWIDSSYINPSLWSEEVLNLIGNRGSGIEKGIQFSYLAASIESQNNGFWRDNSTLAIIYVSDEMDYSVNGVNYYYPLFDQLKPNGEIKVYAVIGDYPTGCTLTYYPYRHVEFGDGYYQLTQRYGGQYFSICSVDWGQQIQSLASLITLRSNFSLSEPDPVESSIRVFVNGNESSSWSYNSSDNNIVFDAGHWPSNDQTVEIQYEIWGCGE